MAKKKLGHTKPKISPYLIPFVIFASLLFIGGAIILPTKVLTYQEEVPYIDKEQYTVEVPYESVESYIVQVPYETTEQYVESIPYQETEDKYYTNCDSTSGCSCTHRSWLGLGPCDQCQCTVTQYKDVIKEKAVTKYRDETRYRTVTKTRTEIREREVRKTRIETKQKEVNWLFGFDAIIKFRRLE